MQRLNRRIDLIIVVQGGSGGVPAALADQEKCGNAGNGHEKNFIIGIGLIFRTCGACSSGCPATGLEGMDPRKFLRMAALGLDEGIFKSDWPWMCTMCQRCIYVCPMQIDFPQLVYNARALRTREERPKSILGSCDMALRNAGTGAMETAPDDYGMLKDQQIEATGADYCIAGCHNCHVQIHELSGHYGGGYPVVHLWTLICLSLGILGPNEREHLGDDLKEVNVFHPESGM
jgi:Fe-S oxidoreductase